MRAHWLIRGKVGDTFGSFCGEVKDPGIRMLKGWLATHLSIQNLILEWLPKEWWMWVRKKGRDRRDTFPRTPEVIRVNVPRVPTV